MKRTQDEANNDGGNDNNKTPIMRAIVQQAVSNLFSNEIEGFINSPTGEQVLELCSPVTPATRMKPRKLIQSYPQSTFWLKQLGRVSDIGKTQSDDISTGKEPSHTTHNNGNNKKMRIIKQEDWEKMESGFNKDANDTTKQLLEIIKRIRTERKENSNNLDPISNKEIKPAGRRSFYLRVWEEHIHGKIMHYAGVDHGVPFTNEHKQLKFLNSINGDYNIQVNISMDSSTEENLIDNYKKCNNEEEKHKIYDALFLHFALSFNCLRPQTGKNTFFSHKTRHFCFINAPLNLKNYTTTHIHITLLKIKLRNIEKRFPKQTLRLYKLIKFLLRHSSKTTRRCKKIRCDAHHTSARLCISKSYTVLIKNKYNEIIIFRNNAKKSP